MNDKNIDFYKKIDLDKFKEFARLIGLDTKIDIDLIYPHIQSAKILVEFGAGYGRVIDALLEKKFEGKIFAYERVHELVTYLKAKLKKYGSPKSVELIEEDFKTTKLKKIDAVLWLWSGFLELSPQEQQENVSRIYNALNEKGILVIEIPIEVKHIGTPTDRKMIKVETDWGSMEAYMPSYEELVSYGTKAGFVNIERINYNTSTNLKRTIYLFKK